MGSDSFHCEPRNYPPPRSQEGLSSVCRFIRLHLALRRRRGLVSWQTLFRRIFLGRGFAIIRCVPCRCFATLRGGGVFSGRFLIQHVSPFHLRHCHFRCGPATQRQQRSLRCCRQRRRCCPCHIGGGHVCAESAPVRECRVQTNHTCYQVQTAEGMLVSLFLEKGLKARRRVCALLNVSERAIIRARGIAK